MGALRNPGCTVPYGRMVTITNHDTNVIATGVTDAVIVLVAGNAVIIDAEGNSTTHTGCLVNSILPVRVVRVNATGTTATLGALYY